MEVKAGRAVEQFNICRSALKNLREQKDTCDIYLACEDGTLPAHQIILRAGSKYFETMFSSDLKEASTNEVKFPTIRVEVMTVILDFIYLLDVDVKSLSDEQTGALLSAAHLVDVYPLFEMCVDELLTKLGFGNWTTFLIIAKKYEIKRLLSAVVKFTNYHDISEDTKMLTLEYDCVSSFVTNSLLEKYHLPTVLVATILGWVKYNKVERKKYLQDLLSPIEFVSVSKYVLAYLIEDNDLFINNLELSHFLLKKISQTFTSKVSLNVKNQKLLIFKSNTVYSFALLTGNHWAEHSLLETLMPDPNSPIVVSDKAVYYTAEIKSSNKRESSIEMRIIVYYPHLNCGNEIARHAIRTKFAMTCLKDDLYLFGGVHNFEGNRCFECCSLYFKYWRNLKSPKFGRVNPTLVTLDKNLYVFGGKLKECSYSPIREVEKYCPSTDQWTVVTSLPDKISENSTVAPCLGKIYVANHATDKTGHPVADDKMTPLLLFEFDPKNNSWKEFTLNYYDMMCGSNKPLNYLIFLRGCDYLRLDPREMKFLWTGQITKTVDVDTRGCAKQYPTIIFV